MPRGAPAGLAAEDGLVLLAFVVVPLACSAALRDQFTSVKWFALHAVAIGAAAAFTRADGPWPRFARTHALLLTALVALATISAFRSGAARAVSPLLDRFTAAAMALLLYRHLGRRAGDLGPIGVALTLAVAATDAYLLAQQAGYQPLPVLTGGDFHSAFFGNVNIAAQFLALAMPCLFWTWARSGRRIRHVGIEIVMAVTCATVILLRSRSAALATAIVLLVWMLLGAVPKGMVVRLMAGAALLVWIVGRTAPASAGPAAPPPLWTAAVVTNKAETASIRLALWRGSLRMIADHPFGVGAANFPDRFVPYQLAGLVPNERILYRWPHNEWLRVAAEDGLPFLGLAVFCLWRLAGETRRGLPGRPCALADRAFLASLGGALGIESLFQFPFSMASGALFSSLAAAFAVHVADGAPDASVERPSRPRGGPTVAVRNVGWGLIALAASIALVRVARAEYLFDHARGDRDALETACALDPRRADACVLAAWQEIRAGDVVAGRLTLQRLLHRSPYFYPAVKLLGQEALADGRMEEGCLYLWMYDGLFAEASSVHAAVVAHCPPALITRFRTTVPRPRYEELPITGRP